MTAATIDLTAFDLADRTDRLVLADLLADAGRDEEADLLRDEDADVTVCGGVVTAVEPAPAMTLCELQGETEHGEAFGYVAGDEGGWFFVWGDSLTDTLNSLTEDEDGDGGLSADEVVEFLTARLPRTRRGRRWDADAE